MLHSTQLHAGWTVRAGRQEHIVPDAVWDRIIPATVPGNVHTDLQRAGLLEDPYFGRNELLVQWVGQTEWIYETEFHVPEIDADNHELVFEGLDSIATVSLNDVELGRTANQHREYRFDVSTAIRAGANRLSVSFSPVRDYAVANRVNLGDRPHNYPEPYNFVRKSAANFGWDWGPNLVTVGMWKPVRLEAWSGARLTSVRPTARVDGDTATVSVDLAVAEGSTGALAVQIDLDGSQSRFELHGGPQHSVTVDVLDPELWWPRGLGQQRLYSFSATLLVDGVPVDRFEKRIGFRTVEHRVGFDDGGREYSLRINGVDLFIRGVNWIPDDCFLGSLDPQRYARRLKQAADANVNLVRVWGGGVYEKDEFYDLCDEMGMLVSQDFLFACAAYPEEEPLFGEVEAEARQNIARIATHPSMVLWNGSNENIWGYFDWGWQDLLGDSSWGLRYYLELLPALVEELSPDIPYWPSSPYSGSMELHPNDPSFGNQHLWDVWNRVDYTTYADVSPRFVSEFGYQGPANWATIRESVSDEPLSAVGVDLLHHQKARDGNGKLERGMAPHLPAPIDFDEWHYFTQLNQARAVAFGIEHFRSLRPYCMGAIMWQLNDCWPVTSWAAIDGGGRLKPLWYEMKRVFADRLVTIQPRGAAFDVVVLNDGPEQWQGTLVAERVDTGGNVVASEHVDLTVPAHSSHRFELSASVAVTAAPSSEGLRATFAGARTLRFFSEDRDMNFGTARYAVEVKDKDGGVGVTVTADTLVRDLIVAADRVDGEAVVDSQIVTLFPGESHTFLVSTTVGASHPSWKVSAVVRAVNDSAHYGGATS
jgi:beta-mannosidase